jgi:hypothetical protein
MSSLFAQGVFKANVSELNGRRKAIMKLFILTNFLHPSKLTHQNYTDNSGSKSATNGVITMLKAVVTKCMLSL